MYYKSTLELLNVDYTCAKYYYCVKIESVALLEATLEKGNSQRHMDSLVSTHQTSRIYLFVEGKFLVSFSIRLLIQKNKYFSDPEHPIAHVGHNISLFANLTDDIVVPCKPTSKNVTVKLFASNRVPVRRPDQKIYFNTKWRWKPFESITRKRQNN